jgi:hypothetical protein
MRALSGALVAIAGAIASLGGYPTVQAGGWLMILFGLGVWLHGVTRPDGFR